jgi:hypothetical protein
MARSLSVPRGKLGLPPIVLDLSRIDHGESRLKEVSYVTPLTSRELSSFFNEVTNEATKYLAWIEYEILRAKKECDIARARVILEKVPAEAEKLMATGMKANSEWRDALIATDPEYQQCYDIVSALTAIKYLLEGKAKTFERAYFSAKLVGEERSMVSATPNLNGVNGQLNGLFGDRNGK